MSHPTHEPAGPPGLDRGAIEALAEARHGDPFAVLGPGPILGPGRRRLVVIRPDADEVGAVAQQDGRPLGVLAMIDEGELDWKCAAHPRFVPSRPADTELDFKSLTRAA